jgi:hypothetical protein
MLNLPTLESRTSYRAVIGAVSPAIGLRVTQDVVSIETAARALELDRSAAAKLQPRWAAQGWMRGIGQL